MCIRDSSVTHNFHSTRFAAIRLSMSATACTWQRQDTLALSAALTPEHTLSSTAADSTVEVFMVVGPMEEDSMVVDLTEVGTADTAGNLSVISYKL